MRAITLWHPWAFFIAAGWKKIETRPASKGFRIGMRVAIHAAKRPQTIEGVKLCTLLYNERPNTGGACHAHLRPGIVVAVATVVGLSIGLDPHPGRAAPRQLTREGLCWCAASNLCDTPPGTRCWIPKDERPVGDFRCGRYYTHLGNVTALERPFPIRGLQGLWQLPAAAVEKIPEELR